MEIYEENDQIGYIYSHKLVSELNKIEKISGRAERVNALIKSYNLFDHLKIVNPFIADEKLLKTFHSQNYIDYLKKLNDDGDEDLLNQTEDECGIGYDCPFIENMLEFCQHIGGASITAAHLINTETFKYVINWFGGWHHAKREKASGFCYVNDINLCILKLRQKYSRILYLDLDQHHGDGVQEAFEFTNKVMTVSFHKLLPGFFPGTGSVDENGKGNGLHYTVNVPFFSGVDDEMFYDSFSKIFNKIHTQFRPEVIVMQCGADSLYGDPIDLNSPFNLTVDGYCKCIQLVIDKNVPAIFLGGGGYNFANTSRLWCAITGLLVNKSKSKLCNDIPEHEYFLEYKPDYELNTTKGLIKNKMSEALNQTLVNKIIENLNSINI